MLGWNRDKEYVHVVEDERHPVAEILCLWQPAEGHDMNGLPCRGFAGQILFFGVGEEAPLEVGGDVMIYVFDDHGTYEDQQKPIHQFEFPGETWATYLRKTNFGASYQLFIPYTRRTSEAAGCTLRLRYTSPHGRVTFSKMLEVALPGTPRQQPPLTELNATNSVLQSSFLQPADVTAADVTQASHFTTDSRLRPQPVSGDGVMVANSQLLLSSSHLTSQRMASLEQLVSSLEEDTQTQTTSTPQTPDASQQAAKSESSSTHPLTTPTATAPTPPTSRHRLHPLAVEGE